MRWPRTRPRAPSTPSGDPADGGYTWVKGASALSANFEDRLLLEDPQQKICDAVSVAQGAYDNVIAADPTSPNVVWAGGIDLFRSTDGGITFAPMSSGVEVGQPQFLHQNQHAILFHPSTGNMIVGNDGGVFTKTSGGSVGSFKACPAGGVSSNSVFASLNNGYSVTQFNSGAVFPDDKAYLGGAQGNGIVKGTDAGGANAWSRLYAGGEGGGVAVDPTNPSVIVAANDHSAFRKSTDGGVTFPDNPATSTGFWNFGITDAGFLLVAPLVMDPTDAQRLWTGGSRLWRSNDQGDTWSAAGAPVAASISAIAVAPSDPNFVLAGTKAGVIHRTAIGLTTTPTTAWLSVTPRTGYVSSLAFDPTNANVAYATYSTFGGIHVYKTLNAGATWADADGTGVTGIPDIPVHTVVVDPVDTQRLYAGTDLGVFVSLNGGTTWAVENTGFAKVITESLVVNGANLYAFTHGRGAWRVPLTNAAQTTTLDFDTIGDHADRAGHRPPSGGDAAHRHPRRDLGRRHRGLRHGQRDRHRRQRLHRRHGHPHLPRGHRPRHDPDDRRADPPGHRRRGHGKVHGGPLRRDGRRSPRPTPPHRDHQGRQRPSRAHHRRHGGVGVGHRRDVHRDPRSRRPRSRHGRLGHRRRHGGGGHHGRLHRGLGHPQLPRRDHLQDPHRTHQGRHVCGGARDLLRQPERPHGRAVVVDGQGVATINDNDVSGTLQFSAPTYTVAESGLKATITVTRTGGVATGVTVQYQTTSGSATAPGDYTTTTGTLSFGAATSATFSVPVVNDTLDENDETVNLQLLNPTGFGAVLGAQSTAVLTITDNDTAGALTFSAATYTAVEGNAALITVKRTGGAASGVTVHYATSDGSASQPADYTAASGDLTFAANETQKTFSVPLVAENPILVEGDETVNLTLSAPTGGGVLGTPSTAVLTIQDASPKITFTAASISASETATTLKVGVSRTGPAGTVVTVPYSTSDGTAKTTAVGGNPADYTAAAGTLTFAAGITSQTITLTLKPDTVVEGPESFTLTLGSPTGGLLGAISTETVNIVDEDAGGVLVFGAPTFSVNEPLTAPGAAPAKASITVKRTSGTASGVTVHWSTSDGTALAPADYTTASGTLTFAAGITSLTFTVDVPPDNDVEGYETFGVALDTPTGGASLGTVSNATVTIVDSEPVIQFAAATYTVSEGVAKATVGLKRTGSLVGAITVNLATAGGTATYGSGGDYNNLPATVVMASGLATKSFTFDVLQDAVVEPTETAPLTVTGCTPGCTVGPQAGTVVSITDDEPVITFSAAAYSVGEATAKVTLTLKRTGSLTAPVDVSLAVTGGTATGGGVDYNNVPLTVTMPANLATKTFTIDIVNDTLGEANETVQLQITGVAGGYVGALKDTVLTITDNEPVIAFSAAAYTGSEPANTTTVPVQLLITVKRTGLLTQACSVDYAIVGATATEGVDYVPTAPTLATGTLNFAANASSVTFKISILADLVDEPDETVALTLSNAVAAKLGPIASATVTLKDND